MKKANLLLSLLLGISIIILVLAFFDKRKEETNKKEIITDYTINIEFNNDKQLLAVAYLNNIEEISSKYIFNLENIKVFQTNGNEKYLIIPRYNDIEISIYEASFNEDKFEKSNKIANTNLPFIINCNESENVSNIIIEVKYNNEVFDYSPSINLKDNNSILDEHILNITK